VERGTRKIGQRYFLLAGRGERETAEREAQAARQHWRYVRIVRMNRYADDWGVYVFERTD
jgi:hypothetical protein